MYANVTANRLTFLFCNDKLSFTIYLRNNSQNFSMKKFFVVLPVLFLSVIILPKHVFAAAVVPAPANGVVMTASGVVIKTTDQTPLTAAQSQALSAAMNKAHNEKAIDKKLNAQIAKLNAKHKAAVKKVAKKKVVVKKKIVAKKK